MRSMRSAIGWMYRIEILGKLCSDSAVSITVLVVLVYKYIYSYITIHNYISVDLKGSRQTIISA